METDFQPDKEVNNKMLKTVFEDDIKGTGLTWVEIMLCRANTKVLRPVHEGPGGSKYVRLNGRRFFLKGEQKLYHCFD